MQGKSRLFSYLVFGLIVGLFMGCSTGPSFQDDSAYRATEREIQRTGAELAITGADISAGVDQIDQQASRVTEGLASIEAGITASSMGVDEKGIVLRQVAVTQGDAGILSEQVKTLHGDVDRLNAQLAHQRELGAALSEEHYKREAEGAKVKSELEEAHVKLAKTTGQRNLYLAIMIALAVGILAFIAIKVLRFLRVIPV